jgi:hypothetical protein
VYVVVGVGVGVNVGECAIELGVAGHIKKQPNFTPTLFQSIISTTNNDHWRTQRSHLNDVFLPHASLSQIFHKSASRVSGATC